MTQRKPRLEPAVRRISFAAFLAETRGNLLPLFAIMLPVMLFSVGAAIDYTSAARRQEAIDGIADAAALAGTQPAMMDESCATGSNTVPSIVLNPPATGVSGTGATNQAACNVALQQVVSLFDAQVTSLQNAGVSGVSSVQLTSVSILDNASNGQRTVTVNWTGASNNLFATILGMPTIAISDVSVAKNSPSPVVLFYMLIDETPSMAFPAQVTGINAMNAATANSQTQQNTTVSSCALGCHAADPNDFVDDNNYNPSNMTCSSAGYFGATAQFPCVQGSSYTIKSGTYSTTTGLVTLTLNSSAGLSSGSGFYLKGLTGTGAFASLDSTTTGGSFSATTGTSGTTVKYTATTGLGATTITGGTLINTIAPSTTGGPNVGTLGSTVGCATTAAKSGLGLLQPQATTFTGSTATAPAAFTSYFGAEDNFALARCLGVQLRIDLVNQAVSNLLSYAPTMAAENKTTYAVNIYAIDLGPGNAPNSYNTSPVTTSSVGTVDVGLEPIYFYGCTTATASTCLSNAYTPSQIVTQSQAEMTANFASATAASGLLQPLETYVGGQTTSGQCGDQDSALDLMLSYLYGGTTGVAAACGATTGTPAITAMSTPGTGLNQAGNAPEEVLFIVSDGMNDVTNAENSITGGNYPCSNTNATNSSHPKNCYWGRPLFPINSSPANYCSEIKAKGIRIAFLYLQYNTLFANNNQPGQGYWAAIQAFQYPTSSSTDTTNSDYPGSYTDEIEQSAISCASPGLEFTVQTGANITSAMETLFQKAVQTAYLAH